MSIEIRQLLIKSNVVHRREAESDTPSAGLNAQQAEDMKEDILTECRRMVAEILQERGER